MTAPEPVRPLVAVDPAGDARSPADIIAGYVDEDGRVRITHPVPPDPPGYGALAWYRRVAAELAADAAVPPAPTPYYRRGRQVFVRPDPDPR